jgi:hypothetical protein
MGQTETISSAGDSPFVRQMLGDLFEPASDEPIERLQNKKCLAEAVEQLPGRIATGEVGQLVCEEASLVFDSEVIDSLRTTDLRLSDARGKGQRDGCRRAEANGPTQTHGGGQALDETSRGTKAPGIQQASEVEGRSTEDQQRQQ